MYHEKCGVCLNPCNSGCYNPGDGIKYFLFLTLFGKDSHIDFSDWLLQPPTSYLLILLHSVLADPKSDQCHVMIRLTLGAKEMFRVQASRLAILIGVFASCWNGWYFFLGCRWFLQTSRLNLNLYRWTLISLSWYNIICRSLYVSLSNLYQEENIYCTTPWGQQQRHFNRWCRAV